MEERRFSLTMTVTRGEAATACELLADRTGLSRIKIKEAMRKGAVWLRPRKGRGRRLRRARTAPAPGDLLQLFYDEALLRREPPAASCLVDERRYSVWFKPAGLLAQGNEYGDHCSLLRQAELQLQRPVFPVHRLDREAMGLMLVAHDQAAAAGLSRLFQEGAIRKQYEVRVMGRPEPAVGAIALPLDGKPALTEFALLREEPESGSSLLAVELRTGRLHQIRRHFALLGHPVLGDPRYGRNNRCPDGLQLLAAGLEFRCPLSGRSFSGRVPANLRPWAASQEPTRPQGIVSLSPSAAGDLL